MRARDDGGVKFSLRLRNGGTIRPVVVSNRLLYWGWLRMTLGVLQMSCALAAAYAIFRVGFEPVTWALAAGAFASSALSRWLYRGRRDPALENMPNDTTRKDTI